MDAIQNLSLETFLPVSRMRDLVDQGGATSYRGAKPFPHIVMDDFFDSSLLETIRAEFPAPGEIAWRGFKNQYEIKLFSTAEQTFGPMTRLLLYHLNSITFLDFLSEITGIPDLIPDPTFNGGGMHQIQRGGKLGIHADFNRHKKYGLDRRLNLLVYLNRDWREEYGGHLELWDTQMSGCQRRVLPVFNRVVIFSTTDFSYHGHPEPLQCPPEMTRKSLAMYYYTNGRPASEVSKAHSTIFRARHEGEFGKPNWRARIRAALKGFPQNLTRR
jgi:Rps23 Pro-64 3,4-dihydroxylase Tpa1-like proline 4-hydroxylase